MMHSRLHAQRILSGTSPMATTRRVFRFNIGQGMWAIAALALTFAFLPMPVAIAFACLTTSLLALRRGQLSNPAHVETIGCLPCSLGFFGGVILAGMLVNPPSARSGPSEVANAFYCGGLGAMTAAVVGQLVALTLSGRRPAARDPSEKKREAARAEIELVGRLLVRAEQQGEEGVRMKLAAYRARLEEELPR
jgi:hypothetical protein